MTQQSNSVNREIALSGEVRKMLRTQDASSLPGSMGTMLKGLGVCLGGGFVVATILWLISLPLFDISFIGWRFWFWLYLAGNVALVVLYEIKSRKDFVTEVTFASDPDPTNLEAHPVQPFDLNMGLVGTVLSWGPRALIDGFRGLRGLRTFADHAAFDRASVLVVDLAKKEGGIEIKKLIRPPEDMQVFSLAIDLLDTHGWIGKATDGQSLWLNSTFREKYRKVKDSLLIE